MSFNIILSFLAAILAEILALFVLYKDRHSFILWTFAAGMILLGLEAFLNGLIFQTSLLDEVNHWFRLRMVATAIIPGVWLLFALTYARLNYKEILVRWRWMVLATFAIPITLVTFFWRSFFPIEAVLRSPSLWVIPIGWSGYVFYLCFLISAILILVNLERTLRGAVGHMQWQIKYMMLGIGGIWGVRIYTSSQTILFHSLNIDLMWVSTGALIVASVLIFRSLLRTHSLNLNFYLSHSVLYNSLTILIVGIYFLAVGVLAKLIQHLNGNISLGLNAFFVFMILLGLSIVLLSDRLRFKTKRFINIHFKRPQYDYRKEWSEFTQATASLMEAKDYCSVVVKKISKTFEALSVTIWLLDERKEHLLLGGTTVLTDLQLKNIMKVAKVESGLISAMRDNHTTIDLDSSKDKSVAELKKANPHYFKEARIRYCVPLTAGDQYLGLLTLDDRVAGVPFSVVDFDLIKTIADQTAAKLLNLKFTEHLHRVKQMEALQTMSAFMMHDLKNLASTISLTLQNLPIHFDNPEFRNDALRMMEQSVSKINNLCSNLSTLGQKIELKRMKTDLNELVQASLSSMNGFLKVSLIKNLHSLPKLMIDPEQILRVITNLILNAREAVGDGGEIQITTGQREDWTILSVGDNGCGISKEFMEQSLFHPFKTTKKQGMGIGLFQSKMIIEAHHGRIEVESEEGRGSTFRVFLPHTME